LCSYVDMGEDDVEVGDGGVGMSLSICGELEVWLE
jgi:hypothetical protein